jgi:ribosome-binding factor A
MSERHLRVESLLREMIATYVVHEANPDPMITITSVSVSPDYRNATVFFTTIPESKEQDALVFLKRAGSEMRRFVQKKSDLKITPSLQFSVDSGERARQYLDNVAKNIK